MCWSVGKCLLMFSSYCCCRERRDCWDYSVRRDRVHQGREGRAARVGGGGHITRGVTKAIVFESGHCQVARADLRSWFSCFSLLATRITDMGQYFWLQYCWSLSKIQLWVLLMFLKFWVLLVCSPPHTHYLVISFPFNFIHSYRLLNYMLYYNTLFAFVESWSFDILETRIF